MSKRTFDWDRAEQNMFKRVPGLTREHGSYAQIDDDGDTVFIKFMADQGVHMPSRKDNANGRALTEYLRSLGIAYESGSADPQSDPGAARKVNLPMRSFKRLFG